MKRRSFLASGVVAGALTAVPVLPVTARSDINSTAVVITDITATTKPDRLLAVVNDLITKGVWVTCGVRIPQPEEPTISLAETIRALLRLVGGVEFAVQLPDLALKSPYFQARAVYGALENLQRILGNDMDHRLFRSVLCDDVEKPNNPSGTRASGVRTVLVRPRESQPVNAEKWSNGVIRFFGGQIVTPDADFTFESGAGSEGNNHICYISAKEIEEAQETSLDSWVLNFADTLLSGERMGQIALVAVPDLVLRDNFEQQRLIAIVLEIPERPSTDESAHIDAFLSELEQLQIPSSKVVRGSEFWVSSSEQGGGLIPITADCRDGAAVRISAPLPITEGFSLRFTGYETDLHGIDGCAFLNLPTTRIESTTPASNVAERLVGLSDVVLSIAADQVATIAARRQIVSVLTTLRHDTITRFSSVGELAAVLHSYEPTAVRHRMTRAAVANKAQEPVSKNDEAERARLLEDARHAWGYFEQLTNPTTGLSPAKVDLRSGGQVLNHVTMWDVGSNLNGIIAAYDLGLIERDQALRRMRKILPFLTGMNAQERLLPQGLIRIDQRRYGNRDFDGCDAGRLLASFDNVRRHLDMEDELESLVGSWDLDKIIINREIHSVTDQELISTYSSHCAHYAALAFRRWGLDAASPYETFDTRSSGDGEMVLLETVSRIGPLGAEPLLLEAMELGMSPESAYLADVLISALREEYEVSGRLLCVSETPIDRPPWFIYQGLELGSGPRSWRLDTVGHRPEYHTEEAAEEYLTFSTKAAYLWAAYEPGAFSQKLLSFARQSSRGSVGFYSGTSLKTMQPMSKLTDLNTNGIVLQAIAHILG